MALSALQAEQAGSPSPTPSWPSMTRRRWRGRRGCVGPAGGYGERSGHSTAVDRAAWNVQMVGFPSRVRRAHGGPKHTRRKGCRAEEKLGAALARSYRQAVMTSNGGEVAAYDDVLNLHPVLDSSDRKRLSRSCNDIHHETCVMRDWPGWPENAVAIADNSTGEELLFLREDQSYQPTVYVWLHDTGALRGGAQFLGASARR
jgi:hypothetical protein